MRPSIFLCLCLTLSLSLSLSLRVDAAPMDCGSSQPVGSLDEVTPGVVAGWAKDPDYDGPIAVHIYIDGVLFAPFVANLSRSDVGPHAFEWVPPPLGAGKHSVVVYAIGVTASGEPDGCNPSLPHSPGTIDGGCEGLEGSPLAWCNGVPSYWKNRQRDTKIVGNNAVRVGVNTAYGGTIFQMYRGWDQQNLVLEHGGGAGQLSIWGYDDKGPDAYFRRPKDGHACDPTPYATSAECEADGSSCNLRCCSQGSHVLNCVSEQPCGGWTAGAPWNPIQAMAKDCFWLDHIPTSFKWVDPETLYTIMPAGYHFTSNSAPANLTMEQWVNVQGSNPYAKVEYRLTYHGPAHLNWTVTTQEMPAFFTSPGIKATFSWYNGSSPWTGGAVTTVSGPPDGFLKFPDRPTYPHPSSDIGTVAEGWWTVCSADHHCVTLATWSEFAAEAAVSASSSSSDGAYITPIGYFGVYPGMDVQWTVYMFPYSFEDTPPGSTQTVRDIIQGLAPK